MEDQAPFNSLPDDDPLRVAAAPTLRQRIVDRLREAIETGELPPGSRLIERDLCARMGVSRTSIREALRELEAANLITSQINKGPVVTVVTPEMARSIYEVRMVLEGLAARLFTRRASAAEIETLKASVEDLARVYENYTAPAFLKAKAEFYRILLAGARNPVAADMLRAIHTRVSQLRATSLADPTRARESMQEIRDFVAALAARNEEAAWHLCVHHIQNASIAALRMLEAPARGTRGAGPQPLRARTLRRDRQPAETEMPPST
jgi:DNA-binding GntR family transcriptional regulator